MGNCCKPRSRGIKTRSPSPPVRPKTTSVRGTSILVALDVSSTPESSRLKTSLKGRFGGLVPFNNQRQLLDQIESTHGYKYFIVIFDKVKTRTLESLVDNPKVVAIYLFFENPNYDQIPESTKIKGFFENQMDLERAIDHDIHAH